jgi:hypothetical protein
LAKLTAVDLGIVTRGFAVDVFETLPRSLTAESVFDSKLKQMKLKQIKRKEGRQGCGSSWSYPARFCRPGRRYSTIDFRSWRDYGFRLFKPILNKTDPDPSKG